MMVDILILYINTIHFGLKIVSCDYNIIASIIFWKQNGGESRIVQSYIILEKSMVIAQLGGNL